MGRKRAKAMAKLFGHYVDAEPSPVDRLLADVCRILAARPAIPIRPAA